MRPGIRWVLGLVIALVYASAIASTQAPAWLGKPDRIAEGKARDDVRSTRDRGKLEVRLHVAIDVIETFRRKR